MIEGREVVVLPAGRDRSDDPIEVEVVEVIRRLARGRIVVVRKQNASEAGADRAGLPRLAGGRGGRRVAKRRDAARE